ncbi:hypothetical protein [Planococcus beijingensis]|uniref:hypothetical protein n=1 Tax=Planococcus beijingensis TaxID=2782551 RepID=UPI00193C860D|nr:hypothetical protein [Planococcus beijingensis]
MDNWKNNTIWFEDIPTELQGYINLKEEKMEIESLSEIEYLTLWHYKSKLHNFEELPYMEKLLYLELNWSNQHDFFGAKKFPALKRLELHYCTKLASDHGISNLASTLEHLHINQSKKFEMSDELLSLKNLRVLCLNSCADLPNLGFLKHFPQLINFRFVDTKVVDGDLTPILEHPTIRRAGTMDKRHYNMSSEKLNRLLEQKDGGQEYRSVVKKGKWETFRYVEK